MLHIPPTSLPTGATQLFPIVGFPVGHVRAPTVFNTLFAQARLDALCVPLGLPPECVLATCAGLLASPNVGGLLVTVPYKKTLVVLADELSERAQIAGAINALRRAADGRVHGDLLDGLGFVHGLRAAGHEPAGRRFLLLGAGGAGSAIAAGLGEAGAHQVHIYDAHAPLAQQLASHLAAQYPGTGFAALGAPRDPGAHFVVNATPLGMKAGDVLPFDVEDAAAAAVVCDIIMEPAQTRLMAAARARGLAVHGGRAMLDYQVPAYLDFFGLGDMAHKVRIGVDGPTLIKAS